MTTQNYNNTNGSVIYKKTNISRRLELRASTFFTFSFQLSKNRLSDNFWEGGLQPLQPVVNEIRDYKIACKLFHSFSRIYLNPF